MGYFEYGTKELGYLKQKDKKLGYIIDEIGMIKRKINKDLFSALIASGVSIKIG